MDSATGFNSGRIENVASPDKSSTIPVHTTSGYESQSIDSEQSQPYSSPISSSLKENSESDCTSETDSLEDYQATVDFPYGEPDSTSTAAVNISTSTVDSQLSELAATTQLVTGASNEENQHHKEMIPGYLQPQQLAPLHLPLPPIFSYHQIHLPMDPESQEESNESLEPRMDLTGTIRPFMCTYPHSSELDEEN